MGDNISTQDVPAAQAIDRLVDSGDTNQALQDARNYINAHADDPEAIAEFTADLERNGTLPLLLMQEFGSENALERLLALDTNNDQSISRDELLNGTQLTTGAGDEAFKLFARLLAERMDLENPDVIADLDNLIPSTLTEQAGQYQNIELARGLFQPIVIDGETTTLFAILDTADLGDSPDGHISWHDIEHALYWAEREPNGEFARAIAAAGLSQQDIQHLLDNFDDPSYRAIRMNGDGHISADSLLHGSGYNLETDSFVIRDDMGRVLEVHYSDNSVRSFEYNPTSGALTSVTQPDGSVIAFDAATQSWYANGQPFALDVSISAQGEMVVTRQAVSDDGTSITVADYYDTDGTVETHQTRQVFTEEQVYDRASVISDALREGDSEFVITLLSSMTAADLLALSEHYRLRFGVELFDDGDLTDDERILVRDALSRVGDSDANLVGAIDQALTLNDEARRAEAIRNIFSTLSAEQIGRLEEQWADAHGGRSLREHLFSDELDLPDATLSALNIYWAGTDANFVPAAEGSEDPVYMRDNIAIELANLALTTGNLDMFAEAMRTASPEARAYFAQGGAGRDAFVRAFGPNNDRANDYVQWGEISLTTIVNENVNVLWTNEDRIITALTNVSDEQRELYMRGRELASANTTPANEEDRLALEYYNELNSTLRNHAHGALSGFNQFTFNRWEAALMYGESVITQVMDMQQSHFLGVGGTHHDRNAVMTALENMSREDFERLLVQDANGNYPFRDLLLASLRTMMSEEEFLVAQQIINGKVEAVAAAAAQGEDVDAYELSVESGRRSLDQVITDGGDDHVAIVDGIMNMSPADQQRYRDNVDGYADRINEQLRNELGSDSPEAQLAALLLARVSAGEDPQPLGPLGRLLYSDITDSDAAQTIADIEALFDPATLANEEISQVERDFIARIQAGESVVLNDGITSSSLGLDFLVSRASRALNIINEYGYGYYYESFAELQQSPDDVLWSLFNPDGNHRLPLDVKLSFIGDNDEQVLNAILSASPEELIALREAFADDADDYENQLLHNLDPEVRTVIENVLTSWDGASALQLQPADEIKLIELGVWMDVGRIESILGKLDAAGKEELQADYATRYGDLHGDVLELAGDDPALSARLDRMLSTRGDFDARETFYDLMFDLFEVRSGLAADGFFANFGSIGGARDTARMVFDDFAQELSVLMGGNMTAEQHAEFEERFVETIQLYSESKRAFTEQAIMLLETVIGLGCAFIPGLQVFSAKVLIGLFLAGGTMRVVMKEVMLGEEYGLVETLQDGGDLLDLIKMGHVDFILGGINMAANALGPDLIIRRLPVFQQLLGNCAGRLLARGIDVAGDNANLFAKILVDAVQAGGQLSDDAARKLIANLPDDLVRQLGGADEAVKFIRSVVNEEIGNSFSNVARNAVEMGANIGTGSIAGGVTGGLDAYFHVPEGTPPADALNMIMQGIGMGAASGTGGALVFTAGFKALGLIRRVSPDAPANDGAGTGGGSGGGDGPAGDGGGTNGEGPAGDGGVQGDGSPDGDGTGGDTAADTDIEGGGDALYMFDPQQPGIVRHADGTVTEFAPGDSINLKEGDAIFDADGNAIADATMDTRANPFNPFERADGFDYVDDTIPDGTVHSGPGVDNGLWTPDRPPITDSPALAQVLESLRIRYPALGKAGAFDGFISSLDQLLKRWSADQASLTQMYDAIDNQWRPLLERHLNEYHRSIQALLGERLPNGTRIGADTPPSEILAYLSARQPRNQREFIAVQDFIRVREEYALALKPVNEIIDARRVELQNILDSFTDKAGLPRIKLELTNNHGLSGSYLNGILRLRSRYLIDLNPVDMLNTIMHELGHNEQQFTILRHVMDQLAESHPHLDWSGKLTTEQIELVQRAWSDLMGFEWRLPPDYLQDVSIARHGSSLGGTEGISQTMLDHINALVTDYKSVASISGDFRESQNTFRKINRIIARLQDDDWQSVLDEILGGDISNWNNLVARGEFGDGTDSLFHAMSIADLRIRYRQDGILDELRVGLESYDPEVARTELIGLLQARQQQINGWRQQSWAEYAASYIEQDAWNIGDLAELAGRNNGLESSPWNQTEYIDGYEYYPPVSVENDPQIRSLEFGKIETPDLPPGGHDELGFHYLDSRGRHMLLDGAQREWYYDSTYGMWISADPKIPGTMAIDAMGNRLVSYGDNDFLIEPDNTVWTMNKDRGLYVIENGPDVFTRNPQTDEIRWIDSQKREWIFDSEDRHWISSDGNIWRVSNDQGNFYFKANDKTGEFVDNSGTTWTLDVESKRWVRQDANGSYFRASNDSGELGPPIWTDKNNVVWEWSDQGFWRNEDGVRRLVDTGGAFYDFDPTTGLYTSQDGISYHRNNRGEYWTHPDGRRTWRDSDGRVLSYDRRARVWRDADRHVADYSDAGGTYRTDAESGRVIHQDKSGRNWQVNEETGYLSPLDGSPWQIRKNGSRVTDVINARGEHTVIEYGANGPRRIRFGDGRQATSKDGVHWTEVAPDGATFTREGRYTVQDDGTVTWRSSADGTTNGEIRYRPDGTVERLLPNGRYELSNVDLTIEKARIEHYIDTVVPPENRARFRQYMNALESRVKDPAEVALVYHHLNQLLSDNPSAALNLQDRRWLAEQMIRNLAHPERIDQGSHSTCNTATVEERVAFREPGAYAELVSQVATTGRYTTVDGTVIDARRIGVLEPDTDVLKTRNAYGRKYRDGDLDLAGADGQRSWVSEIFQETAINTHYRRRDWDFTGNIIEPGMFEYRSDGVYQYNSRTRAWTRITSEDDLNTLMLGGRPDSPHLRAEQLTDIYNQITGTSDSQFVLVAVSDVATVSDNVLYSRTGGKIVEDYVPIDSAVTLRDTLTKMQEEGRLPAIVRVHTGMEPFRTDSGNGAAGGSGGWHVVIVTSIDARGRVELINTWGRDVDHVGSNAITVDQLFQAMPQQQVN